MLLNLTRWSSKLYFRRLLNSSWLGRWSWTCLEAFLKARCFLLIEAWSLCDPSSSFGPDPGSCVITGWLNSSRGWPGPVIDWSAVTCITLVSPRARSLRQRRAQSPYAGFMNHSAQVSLICVSRLPHSWQPPQWTIPFLLRLNWQQRRGVSKALEMNDIMEVMGWWQRMWADYWAGIQRSIISVLIIVLCRLQLFSNETHKTEGLKSMYQSHLHVQFKWLMTFWNHFLIQRKKNRGLLIEQL